jgi:hypothetical protein
MEHLPVRTGEALKKSMCRGSTSKRKTAGRLNEQVAYPQMWPTPAARDWKDNGKSPSEMKRKSPSLPAIAIRLNPESIGKKLCPKWISVLMGYPSMWTKLEPWAIAYVLSKRKKRSKS